MRTFVGHRGNVRMIRSDSFKPYWAITRSHLCISGDGSNKIGHFLKGNGGEWLIWKRNPPLLSNMRGVWERHIRSARALLNSLLKTHESSLSDYSLQTLLVEVETIINSCPLTTDVLNDVISLAPLSPVNLLMMKSKVVMSLPGHFTSPG